MYVSLIATIVTHEICIANEYENKKKETNKGPFETKET